MPQTRKKFKRATTVQQVKLYSIETDTHTLLTQWGFNKINSGTDTFERSNTSSSYTIYELPKGWKASNTDLKFRKTIYDQNGYSRLTTYDAPPTNYQDHDIPLKTTITSRFFFSWSAGNDAYCLKDIKTYKTHKSSDKQISDMDWEKLNYRLTESLCTLAGITYETIDEITKARLWNHDFTFNESTMQRLIHAIINDNPALVLDDDPSPENTPTAEN